MYYIGLDVHKKTISYCVKDSSGQVHQEGKVGASKHFTTQPHLFESVVLGSVRVSQGASKGRYRLKRKSRMAGAS